LNDDNDDGDDDDEEEEQEDEDEDEEMVRVLKPKVLNRYDLTELIC